MVCKAPTVAARVPSHLQPPTSGTSPSLSPSPCRRLSSRGDGARYERGFRSRQQTSFGIIWHRFASAAPTAWKEHMRNGRLQPPGALWTHLCGCTPLPLPVWRERADVLGSPPRLLAASESFCACRLFERCVSRLPIKEQEQSVPTCVQFELLNKSHKRFFNKCSKVLRGFFFFLYVQFKRWIVPFYTGTGLF